MELKDIKVGERYRWYELDTTVVIKSVEPDHRGHVPAMQAAQPGDWWVVVHPADLSPIVRRYTVELRPPKAGERHIRHDEVWTAASDHPAGEPRWVIVDGDQ